LLVVATAASRSLVAATETAATAEPVTVVKMREQLRYRVSTMTTTTAAVNAAKQYMQQQQQLETRR